MVAGFGADVATSALDALQRLSDRAYDAVLLDLGLPDLDGVDVVRGLRGWTSIPIIVLSARDDQAGKVYELGGDHAFTLSELAQEISAAARIIPGIVLEI